MSFLPCNPWIRDGPSLGAMMAARILLPMSVRLKKRRRLERAPFSARDRLPCWSWYVDVLLFDTPSLFVVGARRVAVGVVYATRMTLVRAGLSTEVLRLAKSSLQGIFFVGKLVDEIARLAPKRV